MVCNRVIFKDILHIFFVFFTDLGQNNLLFTSVGVLLNKKRDIHSVTTSSRCLLVIVNLDDHDLYDKLNNQPTKIMNLFLLIHGMQVAKKELHLISSKMNITSMLEEVWKIDNMNFEVIFHGEQHLIEVSTEVSESTVLATYN